MKKLLSVMLVLALCSVASATVVFQVHSQDVTAGQLVTLNVLSDDTTTGLFTMDVIATITAGDATISSAMFTDSSTYGWDYTNYPDTPIVTDTSAQFGGTQFNVNYMSVVGYVKVLVGSGTGDNIVVALTNGYDLGAADVMDGITYGHLDVSDSTTLVVPEPATIALLCLGGLLLRKKK